MLASASPRRAALLRQVGLRFVTDAPAVDETPPRRATPARAALALARRKVAAVRARNPEAVVLAADTTVLLGRRWIGKPRNPKDAREILAALSGRTHRVVSGVVASHPDGRTAGRAVLTQVRFARLSPARIRAYVATGECMDKAGAYAIQGAGAAFVQDIRGDPSNVVGLPLQATLGLLRRVGFPLPLHLQV